MKFRINALLSLIIIAAILPFAAIADEAMKHELRIAIDDGSPDGELFITLDDTDSVNLHELQVGESQSIIDDSGRAILVTRTSDGLELNIDGRIVELPAFDDEAEISGAQRTGSKEVHRKLVFMDRSVGASAPGITIISSETIDDATRDGIRSLLSAAGHDAEIRFIDGSELEGADGKTTAVSRHHHVRVLSKEVEATN